VPQDRAGLVAYQAIENPPGLLGINLSVVDLSRLPQRLLDGFFGDLVEEDAVGGNA
jgi:hypothetical protein